MNSVNSTSAPAAITTPVATPSGAANSVPMPMDNLFHQLVEWDAFINSLFPENTFTNNTNWPVWATFSTISSSTP